MNTDYTASYHFSGKNPFALVPWEKDFLEEVEKLCQAFSQTTASLHHSTSSENNHKNISLSSTNKQNIILVFPHSRPKRYMENRYKKLAQETKKAHILPHIMTGSEFQRECLMHFERAKVPYQELTNLDRISYLHEALIRVARHLPESSVLKRLLKTSTKENIFVDRENKAHIFLTEDTEEKRRSMAKFFPWAQSLDALFEECFTQLVDIIDIPYAENEVTPFAAALLSQLRAIHAEYLTLLEESALSSPHAKPALYRASTPAFSTYRCAQFIKAYQYFTSEKYHTSTFSSHSPLFNVGMENLTTTEQEEFFQNFIPDIFRDKIIIFAGFLNLTQAENVLFQFFWEKGACFLLYSDSNICKNNRYLEIDKTSFMLENSVHYSCEHHVKWLQSWRAPCSLLCSSLDRESPKKPQIHFFSAYDAHSQIKALKYDLLSYLQENNLICPLKTENKHTQMKHTSLPHEISFNANLADDDVALLLPDPSLLMPLLHELPEKDVNISMGYPVSRTLFGQYIELLLSMQEHKNKETTSYVWKEMIALLRHPYAHMLTPKLKVVSENILQNHENEAPLNPKNAWRSILFYLENAIRNATYYIHLSDFLEEHLGDFDALNKTPHTKTTNIDKTLLFHDLILREDLNAFTSNFFQSTLENFEKIESLQALALAIEKFITFLLDHGASLWQSFPLEAESITICVERILPYLRDNALSHEILPQDALFTILRDLIHAERIPFEADPLQGLQILGMLESRLLRFKNVFLLNMTEENLPGTPQKDALMPDALRSLLNLPDSHTREIIVAHTFYRLIAGAEHVWLYWQEGVQSSDIQNGKSLRSRFVEECLWQLEQEAHAILQEDKNIIRTAECAPNTPTRKEKNPILVTQNIKENLLEFLKQGLSASALNTYIQCPAKFFYTYLLKLGEMEEVSEGNDARLFGSWLHKILYQTYKNCDKNGIFFHNALNLHSLIHLYNAQLSLPDVAEFASDESVFMLKNAGIMHLKNYFNSMPFAVKPITLEQNYTCHFSLNYQGQKLEIPLRGICDRVDIRSFDDPQKSPNSSSLNPQDDLCENYASVFNEKNSFHYIMDYKTGKKEKVNEAIWNNTDFWQKIEDSLQNDYTTQNIHYPVNNELLKEIAKAIPNIQLPFYLYLYAQNFPHVLCNAAWLFLGEEDPEISLVSIAKEKDKKENWELLDCIKNNRMPQLLSFVLNHLLNTKNFEACESKACLYCPHKNYC